jgi:hypothetical protein
MEVIDMKVYLVILYTHVEYGYIETYVDGVFDSEEKAKEYIQKTFYDFEYWAVIDTWVCDIDEYRRREVSIQEWEVH